MKRDIDTGLLARHDDTGDSGSPPQWSEAQVVQCLAPAQYRLDDRRLAQQAASCLLVPAAGDTVVLLGTASGLYITHVLVRAAAVNDVDRAQLSVPGAQTLAIVQPQLEVACTGAIALRTLGDVEITSGGAVAVNARHFFAAVAETMVQNAQHLVTHAKHCVLQVAAMLRVHGRQTLITAEQDMKLDAERISLG